MKNTKGGFLVCFRGSGRRCFCSGRGSGVLSMFWTSVVQNDVVEQTKKCVPYASKECTRCKSRAHNLVKCAAQKDTTQRTP